MKILLPKGQTVKEQVVPVQVKLPEALTKLKESRFSGYLRFDLAAGAGILLFHLGRMVDALYVGDGERRFDFDALNRIFEKSPEDSALLHIYRVSPDLALHLHGLLHGKPLSVGQEVAELDIPGLLAKIRANQVTGCLRIYAGDRVVLIFYRLGAPLGFFHEGGGDLEGAADPARSVANLPGAMIEIVGTADVFADKLADLLERVDLGQLWQGALSRVAEERSRQRD